MSETPSAGPSRLRRGVTAALVVLASVAVLAASLAVWARRTVLDSDRFARTAEVVVRDPEVQAAVAARLSAIVVSAVGPTVTGALPEQLRPLEPLLAGAIRRVVDEAVAELLAAEPTQAAVVGLARAAHVAALRVLRGDGLIDTVTVQQGEVTVNLIPLVLRALDRLQERGVLPSSLPLPAPRPEAPVADQIAALEQALGRDLAEDFGQVVVYRSSALAEAGVMVATAQRALALFERAVVLVVVLAGLTVAAAVVVSRTRRRTVLHLGVGVAAAMLLANVIVGRIVSGIAGAIANPTTSTAVDDLASTLVEGLLRLNWVLFALALLIVGGVVVLDRLDARGERPTSWVGTHASAARVVLVGAAVGLVALAGIGWGSLVVAAALLVGGLAGVAAVERRVAGVPA